MSSTLLPPLVVVSTDRSTELAPVASSAIASARCATNVNGMHGRPQMGGRRKRGGSVKASSFQSGPTGLVPKPPATSRRPAQAGQHGTVRSVNNLNTINDWHGGDRHDNLSDDSLSDESTDCEMMGSQVEADVQQPQRVKTLVGEEEWAPYLLQSLFRPTSELVADVLPENGSTNESQFNMDEYLTTCKQVLMSLVPKPPKPPPRLNNKDFNSSPAKAHHTYCDDIFFFSKKADADEANLNSTADIWLQRQPTPPADEKGPRPGPGRRLRSFSLPGSHATHTKDA